MRLTHGIHYKLTAAVAAAVGLCSLVILAYFSVDSVATYALLKMSFPRQVLSQLDLGIGQAIFRTSAKEPDSLSGRNVLICHAALIAISLAVAMAFFELSNAISPPEGYHLLLALSAAHIHFFSAVERSRSRFSVLTASNYGSAVVTIIFFFAALHPDRQANFLTLVMAIESFIATSILLRYLHHRRLSFMHRSYAKDEIFRQEFRVSCFGNIAANINGYFAHIVFSAVLSTNSFSFYALVSRIKGLITLVASIQLKVFEPIIFKNVRAGLEPIPILLKKHYNRGITAILFLAAISLFIAVFPLVKRGDISLFTAVLGAIVLVSEAAWRLVAPLKTYMTVEISSYKLFTILIIIGNISVAAVFTLLLLSLENTSADLAMIFFITLNTIYMLLTWSMWKRKSIR